MQRDLEQLSGLFRLLSDKTRLCLLLVLAEGEQNVTSLARRLSLPQPTISHHLALLRVKGILDSRRHGKQIIYSLNGRVNRVSERTLRLRAEPFTVELVINR
jgi:ArsR family transcriptional regulator